MRVCCAEDSISPSSAGLASCRSDTSPSCSHWVLDFVSHRLDMPLGPGIPGAFGLGLWNRARAFTIVPRLPAPETP